VNIIVSGRGSDFTTGQVVAIARELRVVSVSVPAAVAVTRVGGTSPRGYWHAKTEGFRPDEFTFLAAQTVGVADGGCYGIGAYSRCMPIVEDQPSASTWMAWPILGGVAPARTTRIVARSFDGRSFTFMPARSGPDAALRYFAHWLSAADLKGPLELTMLDKGGAVVARVTSAYPPSG
jgi:hypothetical protein